MNILITGGAGYLGSIMVGKILSAMTNYRNFLYSHSDNYDKKTHVLNVNNVTVFDNLMYRQICLTDYCYRDDFNLIVGDVRDRKLLLDCVKRADIIVPLAAIVGAPACDKDKDLATKINYEQIKFIVDNMSRDQRIIYPNTNSGYGIGKKNVFCTEETPINPISHYGRTKCDAEKVILDSGNGIVFRLATVFGVSPRMRLDLLVNYFCYKAIDDGYVVLFEKDFKRNYIHIHDVALGFIYMMNEYQKFNNNVYNMGLSDANLSKYELCLKIKEYVKDFVIKWDEYKHDVDKRDYIVSNEKLEKTGWKSYYSIERGIRELLKAYKAIMNNNNKKFTNL